MFAEPDTFATSILVYTYKGARIIEKRCEEPGWPNVTHDGEMMYDNTFSTDKNTVVGWAKANARAGLRLAHERCAELRKQLYGARDNRRKYEANIGALDEEFPSALPVTRTDNG